MPILYHLTLQKPTAITRTVYGNFSGPKAHEIIVAKGQVLELLRADKQGKLSVIVSKDIFGIIRSLEIFRLTGSNKDYIAIGSDSGRLVILKYDDEKNDFIRVHCETYGKSGIRRIVPGEYIAVDPKGRALMLCAIEKQKFVYILNRDNKENLTISSPLEAHKSHSICHAVVGLNVGFENPMFVSIEQNYETLDKEVTNGNIQLSSNPNEDQQIMEYPKKGLCFWEMDLGLNHVIKKHTIPIDITAHLLIPLPGGQQGPSGLIVCCENYLVYKKIDHDDVYCSYPRRLEVGEEKNISIVCWTIHRIKTFFFILIQSEYGDLYKIEVNHEDGIVKEIICKYFDTVPIANSICVLKSGALFVAAEFGNHFFYQFSGIGNDSNESMCTSNHPSGKNAIIAFKTQKLKNLYLVDQIYSLSPIIDMKILDAKNSSLPQIYALCGRGPRSSLRILQHGLSIEELANNELPGKPKYIWTIKKDNSSEYDGYIIVSFEGNTLILEIGETVEEVYDSLLLTNVTTIHINLLYDNSFIQVYDTGIRHINGKIVQEWVPPKNKQINAATSNGSQIVVSLSGGELIYFEIDESHTLTEIFRKNINVEILCLSIQQIQQNKLRASFLAVGCLDNVVRLLSIEKDQYFKQLSTYILPNNSSPQDICISEMKELGNQKEHTILYLNIGLNTGVLLRSVIDPICGTLSNHYSKYLGAKSVKICHVQVNKNPALLVLSEKTYLCYVYQGKYIYSPLNYDVLEYASSFYSEQCSDGYVAISGNSLRIFRFYRLGEVFSQNILPLTFTPRKIVPLPFPSLFYDNDTSLEITRIKNIQMLAVIEADHNAYDENTQREIQKALRDIKLEGKEGEEDDVPQDEPDNEEEELLYDRIGTPKAGAGKWGSCIKIINPINLQVIDKVSLELEEAALSVCACELEALHCLIVGTTTNMTLKNRNVPSASLRVYTYDINYKLNLLHITPIEDQPYCFCPFNGRVIVSVGNKLRIYALGKKKLLKKCEYKDIPEAIVSIKVSGDRIFASDIRESVLIFFYDSNQNVIRLISDDIIPRWITCSEILDHHTIMAADKFDSVFILRVPEEAKQEEYGIANKCWYGGEVISSSTKNRKMEHIMSFHIGEIVTSLQKVKLSPASSECIIYSTIMGTIGAFIPYDNKEELELTQHLEIILRTEKHALCGREHIFFRSYYHPVQHVIDGDLCEQFSSLPFDVQRKVASDLEKTPDEILRKLEDIRNKIL
ncbi:splicing factor 3B subunit 3, putative [Plasmodium chabaudi chabaudi]|uniref:Splicing factor 3B subunit 3, putative n=1 Tax=Plasmodium chabaudi chabaudi TaxID=31271 RepID=A0A4V0KDH8_PLACU|nr:splicing factor 3B subunit 3, putative [Plasmodium chabaudi chabaudi]VTZ71192.1 splicing factor 3B subunit 3, putative [Plasmodium chabaudi chabaudi]|eukprot:XP_016655032.1 splicing factor 3B subunit 3, putative [Plasmodium chabaudi chabaudi]